MTFLSRQITLFWVALQFLTRLPAPGLASFEPDMPVRAVRFFPLIGQLIGGLCGLIWVAAYGVWGGQVAAILAVVAGALITGAFHEDGLADTADGLGGGQTLARRLIIMKDSRIGTYGAVALLCIFALRIAALAHLSPMVGALSLVVAHGAARAIAVVVMRITPYVGDTEGAKGRPGGDRPTLGETVCAAIIGLAPVMTLTLVHAVAGLALSILAIVVLVLTARRLIGGHTGDVLGAVEQLGEAGFLLGAGVGV